MPWTEVIDACITHKLQDLPSGDEEIHVNYIPTKLSSYTPPASWFGAVLEPPENGICIAIRPKKLIMFLRHRPHHLESHLSKIFIAFPVFTLKNRLYIANCQFKSAVIASILFVIGWLVDKQLVSAHAQGQKFLQITPINHFYSILLKKIKSCIIF